MFFERRKKLGTVNFQRGQLKIIIYQDPPLVKMSSEKPLAHADLKISGEWSTTFTHNYRENVYTQMVNTLLVLLVFQTVLKGYNSRFLN